MEKYIPGSNTDRKHIDFIYLQGGPKVFLLNTNDLKKYKLVFLDL